MKIGIVGCGMVGATAAYALVMRGVGRKIVMVDINPDRAAAEAADISHAIPFAHPLEVTSGDYSDLNDCSVVVIAAGVGQKPGETRLQLLARNATVFKSVIPEVLRNAQDAVLLVATNPVDVMTHVSATLAKEFDLPAARIVGTGTTLDTARFRSLLSGELGVDPRHVHAYVLGEHGDSEVLCWSQVTVGGMPLASFVEGRGGTFTEEMKRSIEHQVRHAAYEIIARKQATYYGIGSAIASIVGTIIYDRRSILTVSTFVPDYQGVKNVTLSLPHLVGGKGVLETFSPALDDFETEQLRNSAQIVREAMESIEGEI